MNKGKIINIIADTDKNYSPYYDVLPQLINQRGYKSGIEIGVFCGGHAEAILKTGCNLVGVDPYKDYDPGMPLIDNQDEWDFLYDIVMLRLRHPNYRHYKHNSNVAFQLIKQKEFDFIFIDGLHTYEQLTTDLINYEKLIKKGGVIACHDYNHPTFPYLTTAIDEFAAKYNAKVIECPLHLIYIEKTW